MQRSDELPGAATILFQQVQSLGMPAFAAGYCIWDEDKQAITLWMSSEGILQPPFKAPTTEDELFIEMRKGHEEGKSFHVVEMGGKKLVAHYQYMRTLPVVGEIFDSIIEAGHPLPTFQIMHHAYFSKGFLLFITYEPVPDAHDIFKRFAKVFEQTYTRFLDLQKAEAQAREARIETALERIRARALAMHSSEELMDVAKVLREQMALLDQPELETCVVHLYEEDPANILSWRAFRLGTNKDSEITYGYMSLPKDCCELVVEWITMFKSNAIEYIIEVSGSKQKEWYKILASKAPEIINAMRNSNSLEVKRYYHFSKFSGGALLMVSIQQPSEEAIYLKRRAAVVFDLAYRRFVDLKKAETQAREAQIQLALERVRARTMAMQHSDELKDAAALLFQQVKSLGVPAYSCGYNIWEKEDREFTSWMSTQDGSDFNGVPNIPLTEDANFIRYVESKQNGEQFFVLDLRDERMQEHYEYLKTIPAFKAYFDYAESVGFDLPDTQIHHLANFSNGNLLFITLEPCPEFHDVFKRFAAVFEQTYTRFLDLQKAEAQARESQIELGLERVRARAMAMQTSGELAELVDTLFKELTKLDFTLSMCIINIIDEPALSNMVWAASPETGKPPESYYMKFEDYPFHHAMMKGYKERNPKFIHVIEGEEKKIYDEYLFNETEFRKIPEEGQAAFKAMEKYVASFSFSNFGGLQTVSDELLSESNLDILARFGKVFDLTYTRFNDLLKAEAQAREAQIEAALERVRSRTMGMQRSDELPEAANLLFQQIQSLGIHAFSTGYNVWDKNMRNVTSSMSSEGIIQPSFKLPLTEETALVECYDAAMRGEKLFVQELKGEKLVSHFNYMRTLPVVGELMKKIADAGFPLPNYMVNHHAFFSHGYLLFITYEPVPEAHEIFKRFAKVFEQTYTRFLDLQKAEAQAKRSKDRSCIGKSKITDHGDAEKR